jgi:hypothetical protein
MTGPSLLPNQIGKRLDEYVSQFLEARRVAERQRRQLNDRKMIIREQIMLARNMNRKIKLLNRESWPQLQQHLIAESIQRAQNRERRLRVPSSKEEKARLAQQLSAVKKKYSLNTDGVTATAAAAPIQTEDKYDAPIDPELARTLAEQRRGNYN